MDVRSSHSARICPVTSLRLRRFRAEAEDKNVFPKETETADEDTGRCMVLRLEDEDEQPDDDEDEPRDQVLVVLQEVPLDHLCAPPDQGDHEGEDS